MSVNSNVAALAVQRSLLNNTRELATSMQRLNTGVRIISAADDAAGVSIADRMESQIKSYGMAVRNAGDAISMLETAEGGLGSIADTLQRMRVLATTAANGTTVTTDRQALTDEVDQLKAEINRIAGVVKFNGISLLDGSFTNAKFQVGAMGGETITVGIKSAAAVASAFELVTVQGPIIMISVWPVKDGRVMLNSVATITSADIKASNGVIHAIDTGLMPPGRRGASSGARP